MCVQIGIYCVYSGARISFGLSLQLLPYSVYASSVGSGETLPVFCLSEHSLLVNHVS